MPATVSSAGNKLDPAGRGRGTAATTVVGIEAKRDSCGVTEWTLAAI